MNINDQKKMIEVAQSIVDGNIDLIDGCRTIVDCCYNLGFQEEELFVAFRGFVSDTDDVPRGNVRQYWAKESLEIVDREVEGFIRKSKPILIESCKQLIKKYS